MVPLVLRHPLVQVLLIIAGRQSLYGLASRWSHPATTPGAAARSGAVAH